MTVTHWIFLASLACLIGAILWQIWLVFRKANTDDLSQSKGSISSGIIYSTIGAMSPGKKETAYLHLPTYMAGMIYHLGAFLSLGMLFFLFFDIKLPVILTSLIAGFLSLSTLCGVFILVKRMVVVKLRHLSTPDDYFSNSLVTLFQTSTVLALLGIQAIPVHLVITSLLFVYIPVGKLRHIIYFFIARFYLGVFYGKRGVWPPKVRNTWNKEH